MNILVSACLLGENCNYKGENKKNEKVLSLQEHFNLIPICPECFGGMTTPRIPSEILKDKVINKIGENVTEFFINGAQKALKIAKENNCKFAILKSNSPSCGSGNVYDGTFTGTLINGDGITSKLLKENGIIIFNENQVEEFKKIAIKNFVN